MAKWVYVFGDGAAEGRAGDRNLLGGKGANLAEMCSLGLPVPPGFTITTEVCNAYYANGRAFPAELRDGRGDGARPYSPALQAGISAIRRSCCWFRCAPARARRCRA